MVVVLDGRVHFQSNLFGPWLHEHERVEAAFGLQDEQDVNDAVVECDIDESQLFGLVADVRRLGVIKNALFERKK